MSNSNNTSAGFLALIIIAIPVLLSNAIISWTTVRTENITVVRTERTKEVALVWTKDDGVMRVVDDWFQGKFSSSDTYGELSPNGTYNVKMNGWRIPVFSQYPNILEVTPTQQ